MYEKAKKLLPKIAETFPEYTDHNIDHSNRIIDILSSVIPDALKADFNEYELFFLIAAAYFHDIGMVNFPDLTVPTESTKIANFIRDNHHIRTEQFICRNFKELSIDDEHQADIIGRICLGHRKVDLSDQCLFESDRVYKNVSINMALLAAFLRLGDSLDISFERAPAIIYEHSFIRDPISIQEWQKHLSISGVVPQPEDPLTLKANAKCSSPKVHRLLKKLELEVNAELENLPRYLYQYRNHRSEIARKFIISIEPKGYKAFDFKFSLQEAEITKLLMGESLYGRKEESLRELLKNSVDACRARQDLLKKENMKYSPVIKFELTSDRRIVIEDNGIGMDDDIIDRYFTKIGKSFYQSQEFSDSFDFTPVGELGIGFLSSFMIGEKITVETKKESSQALLMEIEDVADFFLVQDGKRDQTGTTVILTLKKEIEFSLEKEIANYARHIEIPILIKLPDKINASEIKSTKFDLCMEKLEKTQNFSPTFLSTHQFYSMPIVSENIEGVIGILVRKTENGEAEPFSNRRLPWNTENALDSVEKLSISNEGIFIGNITLLPKWLGRGNTFFYDLNVRRKALDLTAARNNVINNDKCKKISLFIENKVYELFYKFLSEQRNRSTEINNLAETSNVFFNSYLSLYYLLTAKNEALGSLVMTEQLSSLISQFTYLKCYRKNGAENIKTADLIGKSEQLKIIFSLNSYSEEHRQRIIRECSGFDEQHLYVLWEPLNNSYVLRLVLNRHYGIDFLSLIDMTKSDEMTGFIPSTWILAKFNNYSTSRLIEFCHGAVTVLNRDNLFINLLIANKNHFKGSRKMAIFGFFRTLKIDLRNNFPLLQEKQKDILKIFVEEGIISENQFDNFIIKKEDFPPHILK